MSARNWLRTIGELERMRPVHIVPAHGPTGGSEIIAQNRDYLQTLLARVMTLKLQGKSADDAARIVFNEMRASHPAWGPPNRVIQLALVAYRE